MRCGEKPSSRQPVELQQQRCDQQAAPNPGNNGRHPSRLEGHPQVIGAGEARADALDESRQRRKQIEVPSAGSPCEHAHIQSGPCHRRREHAGDSGNIAQARSETALPPEQPRDGRRHARQPEALCQENQRGERASQRPGQRPRPLANREQHAPQERSRGEGRQVAPSRLHGPYRPGGQEHEQERGPQAPSRAQQLRERCKEGDDAHAPDPEHGELQLNVTDTRQLEREGCGSGLDQREAVGLSVEEDWHLAAFGQMLGHQSEDRLVAVDQEVWAGQLRKPGGDSHRHQDGRVAPPRNFGSLRRRDHQRQS